MSILNIGEKAMVDNSIVNNQLHTHQPYTNRYNNNDEIRIKIPEDFCTLPSQSFLYIEGQTPKGYTFINNGIPHLFSEIRYELNGIIIDSTIKPGITSTMKGYVSYGKNDVNKLENAGWLSTSDSRITNDKGKFNVCIPLSMLLGFAEDYKKVLLNITQELVLIRSNSDVDALIKTDTATTSTAADLNLHTNVIIEKLNWKIPHITPGLVQELALSKYINRNVDTQVAFRSWQLHLIPGIPNVSNHSFAIRTSTKLQTPRQIIVGFQTSRTGDNTKDMSKFDHCNLKDIHAFLNTEKFPYDNLNIEYNKNNYALLYEMYTKFQSSYYNKHDDPLLDRDDYKKFAPLVVIDCTSQKDSLQANAVVFRLEFETSDNIPTDTIAYCLVLHDTAFSYNALTKQVKQL